MLYERSSVAAAAEDGGHVWGHENVAGIEAKTSVYWFRQKNCVRSNVQTAPVVLTFKCTVATRLYNWRKNKTLEKMANVIHTFFDAITRIVVTRIYKRCWTIFVFGLSKLISCVAKFGLFDVNMVAKLAKQHPWSSVLPDCVGCMRPLSLVSMKLPKDMLSIFSQILLSKCWPLLPLM